MTSALHQELKRHIPLDEDGFGNVWPVFCNPELFPVVVDALAEPLEGQVNKIVGIESRGFLLGAAVAARLRVGFVGIRKGANGLYPGPTHDGTTAADYRGNEHLFRLQHASLGEGDVVALVDDWFETGSQGLVAKQLIGRSGALYAGCSIIVDQLSDTNRDLLGPCHALINAADLGCPTVA